LRYWWQACLNGKVWFNRKMRRLTQIIRWMGGLVAAVLLALTIFPVGASAQLGATGGSGSGALANPLPVSGRTGQRGGVNATEQPIPGTTTSVNTLNPSVQVQGTFAGSASSTGQMPFVGKLTLRDAVQRGIAYNLGAVGMAQAVRQAHAQSTISRSALLPNVSGYFQDTEQQSNLAAFGLHFTLPPAAGFSIPAVVGPFNFFDLRAQLTQSVLDLAARNNYHSSQDVLRANQLSAEDARNLVVLAVGGAYLQVIAAEARVQSARAQTDAANVIYQETLQQFQFGKIPQLDVNRSQVEALTQQQRLFSLQNDLGKQKINLARLTGLPPTDQYEISDDVPFAPAPVLTVDDAVKQALAQRADLKAAAAQVSAAQHALTAARDERLPSASVSANYGDIGTSPSQSHGTFSVVATVRVPIWQGGRTAGDIEQAEAALTQRQAEIEDQKAQIEGEVRNAFLDLQAAANEVDVAKQNLQVTQQTLEQTRERLEAGVSNNIELVQSQETVASAQLDYINSVFAHNVAKLSLARAVGQAADNLAQFLKMQ
jgi:outer membrane protein TolC